MAPPGRESGPEGYKRIDGVLPRREFALVWVFGMEIDSDGQAQRV